MNFDNITHVRNRSWMTVIIPDPLKPFVNTVPRHTFSKLFQLATGNGALGTYFQMTMTTKRYYCWKNSHRAKYF